MFHIVNIDPSNLNCYSRRINIINEDENHYLNSLSTAIKFYFFLNQTMESKIELKTNRVVN